MVFGDSRLIIHALNGGSQCKNERLARLINRIKSNAKLFRRIIFFHILRELNSMTYLVANKSIDVGQNELFVNLIVSIDIPP